VETPGDLDDRPPRSAAVDGALSPLLAESVSGKLCPRPWTVQDYRREEKEMPSGSTRPARCPTSTPTRQETALGERQHRMQ
jgi:hypothetical protein